MSMGSKGKVDFAKGYKEFFLEIENKYLLLKTLYQTTCRERQYLKS